MVVCDRMVDHAAKDRLYDSVEDVPTSKGWACAWDITHFYMEWAEELLL